MDLLFNNTQERGEIREALTDYVNSRSVQVPMSLPAALIYGEGGESKLVFSYHPHKLGDAVYDVLHAAKGIHDWHAGVCFEQSLGMVVVFFTTKDDVKIPELLLRTSEGVA